MARSAQATRTTTPATTTSRRQRTIPKEKTNGGRRQLEAEAPSDDAESSVEEGGEDEVATAPEGDGVDAGEATPPEPTRRRGRKPGSKSAAATPVKNSRIVDTATLAEGVLSYGATYSVHPIDVLNSIEALLRATGDITE